jgi:hypothetical protein
MSAIDKFIVIFFGIVIEALPFIIIGALISGILEELLPHKAFARLMPRRRWLAVLGSALLGMIFPMCECGIVPVMRRLLGKGLPLSCAVAYMLAAPIINPVVLSSTWAAFSGDRLVEHGGDGLSSLQMVSLRGGMAFIVAVTVGFIVNRSERRVGTDALVQPILGSRLARLHVHEDEVENHEHCDHEHDHNDHDHANCGHDHGHEHAHEHHDHEHEQAKKGELASPPAHEHTHPPTPTVLHRLMNISETSQRDFVDITCFLILGAMLASIVQTSNVADRIAAMSGNPFLAAPAMMLLAIVLCLCSEADAFVGANLLRIPLAGKLAFLVLGPMLDLKLYLMYTRVFRTRLIWTIIPSVAVLVLMLSLIAHYVNFGITGNVGAVAAPAVSAKP